MMYSLLSIFQKLAFYLALCIILFYIGFNFCYGDHGYFASKEKEKILRQDQMILAQTQQEENIWQRRVDGLKEKSLDPDALDARARIMLNLTGRDDIILLRSHHGPLF